MFHLTSSVSSLFTAISEWSSARLGPAWLSWKWQNLIPSFSVRYLYMVNFNYVFSLTSSHSFLAFTVEFWHISNTSQWKLTKRSETVKNNLFRLKDSNFNSFKLFSISPVRARCCSKCAVRISLLANCIKREGSFHFYYFCYNREMKTGWTPLTLHLSFSSII